MKELLETLLLQEFYINLNSYFHEKKDYKIQHIHCYSVVDTWMTQSEQMLKLFIQKRGADAIKMNYYRMDDQAYVCVAESMW